MSVTLILQGEKGLSSNGESGKGSCGTMSVTLILQDEHQMPAQMFAHPLDTMRR